MPKVAAPKDPKELTEFAIAYIETALAQQESAATKVRKALKKLRQAQKPPTPEQPT